MANKKKNSNTLITTTTNTSGTLNSNIATTTSTEIVSEWAFQKPPITLGETWNKEQAKCSACNKTKIPVFKYKMFKIERIICKSCFNKGMDKLFGIKHKKAEEVLFE